MDQRAPGAAVAVGEGVDGLELGVRQRGLHERRVGVAGEVVEQIGEQRLDPLGWRRDERRAARVVGAAPRSNSADPE